MNSRMVKRGLLSVVVIAILAGLFYALRPLPIAVDVAKISRAPLEVAIEEEGVTRIREVYQVSAPVGGKFRRAPREVGDQVISGKTIVASIEPEDPPFLHVRKRRELQAAVAAARAAITLAEAEVRRGLAQLGYARSDLERSKSLAANNAVSAKTLDQAKMLFDTRTAAVESAKATLELRKRELESAQARLIGPATPDINATMGESCCVLIKAPVSGQVLKIFHESEQVVPSGATLLEIGDPKDLEITVDLLSTDAVKVKPGMSAIIKDWGGVGVLHARVKHIEPSGFKKVSALGIEEQRVKTVLELTEPYEKWRKLGHDFRVFIDIIIWSQKDVLTVPLSALFRQGNSWATFKIVDGTARLVKIKIGHRNTRQAEIIEGLKQGDTVILHPSDRVKDEIRVSVREGISQ